jgi:hypothetical protein
MSNASLGIGCHVEGLGSTRRTYSGARVPRFTFTKKLYGFHNFMSAQKNGLAAWSEWRPLLVHRHGYGFEKLATPHSEQRGFTREVINPQDGHILCD